MANHTVPARPARPFRNIIVGALAFGALAATIGGLANAGVTGDEIARAAVLTSPTGSAFALNPHIVDSLSTGADATGPVRYKPVGNYTDTGATDLGGPNGAYIGAITAAGGQVKNAPQAMQIGKRVVLDLRKGVDWSTAVATAQASLNATDAVWVVDGSAVARAAVTVYAPELSDKIPAAVSAADTAFLGALRSAGMTINDESATVALGHLAAETMAANGGDRSATMSALDNSITGGTGVWPEVPPVQGKGVLPALVDAGVSAYGA